MEADDVIYISLLIFTIVFGWFFRELKDVDTKKWTSTIIGAVLVLFVSGIHILHPIICIIVNGFIILHTNKKTCHIKSFIFSFLYLTFFRATIYFNIPYPPSHTNLIQMILTLKLVSLAFEVHDSYVLEEKEKLLDPPITKNYKNYLQPTFEDVFHYAFFYTGVLTGPYFSYKTYQDFLNLGFYKFAPCTKVTLQTLAMVPVFAVGFLLATHYFPLNYMMSDEFYNDTTFTFRVFYMIPIFFTFRMRIYIGLTLSESACSIIGLGAYPVLTKPRPGMGPSTNLELLDKLSIEPGEVKNHDFDFQTIHNFNLLGTELEPTFRGTIKHWNMCVQYWFAFIVYKRFPNKAFRTAAVFALSAFWHGTYLGYYFCLLPPPFMMIMEDLWDRYLLRQELVGVKRKMVDFVFLLVRHQAFSYMGVAFCLLHSANVIKYYNSIYWIYSVLWAVFTILGLILTKFGRKRREKKE